ncbi:hypothetical protein H2203_000286 [Taxawa tesnikishii (nom. ined.)]|nr:hypothetical protein H2203_000286 [Dothideales sp. JES 119]
MVTNSDSDSVDIEDFEQSSDSGSLDDIDDLIARARERRKASPSAVLQTPYVDQTQNLGMKSSLRSSTRKETVRSSQVVPEPQKTYKFSLANLAKQMKKDAATEARINELEENARKEEEEAKTRAEAEQEEGEDDMLDERVVAAMKRTDALIEEIRFQFFELKEGHRVKRKEFPTSSLPESGWTSLLKDPHKRDQVLASGYAANMASVFPPSTEVLEWMFDQILHETRDHMAYAYTGILEACGAALVDSSLLGTESLGQCLLTLGCRQDVVNSMTGTPPSVLSSGNVKTARALPHGLKRFIEAIGSLSARLGSEACNVCLHVLMLMLIDHDVQQSASIKRCLQDALINLMGSVSEDELEETTESVGKRLLSNLDHAVLMNRLLCSLPSDDKRIYVFKRRLALAFSLGSDDFLQDDLTATSLTGHITRHLRRSELFVFNDDTDFVATGALSKILDVALGAGFSDFAFIPSSPHVELQSQTTPTPEESAFNASIDALVSQLRVIIARIKDAGAVHLARAECKGVLERLAYRLEGAVRTRPKPKKDVFAVHERNALMDRFVQKKK